MVRVVLGKRWMRVDNWEPVPVLKQPGDAATAGTLNQSGAIVPLAQVGIQPAQIVALAEAAQTRKAPVRIAVAGYFTYGV